MGCTVLIGASVIVRVGRGVRVAVAVGGAVDVGCTVLIGASVIVRVGRGVRVAVAVGGAVDVGCTVLIGASVIVRVGRGVRLTEAVAVAVDVGELVGASAISNTSAGRGRVARGATGVTVKSCASPALVNTDGGVGDVDAASTIETPDVSAVALVGVPASRHVTATMLIKPAASANAATAPPIPASRWRSRFVREIVGLDGS